MIDTIMTIVKQPPALLEIVLAQLHVQRAAADQNVHHVAHAVQVITQYQLFHHLQAQSFPHLALLNI